MLLLRLPMPRWALAFRHFSNTKPTNCMVFIRMVDCMQFGVRFLHATSIYIYGIHVFNHLFGSALRENHLLYTKIRPHYELMFISMMEIIANQHVAPSIWSVSFRCIKKILLCILSFNSSTIICIFLNVCDFELLTLFRFFLCGCIKYSLGLFLNFLLEI